MVTPLLPLKMENVSVRRAGKTILGPITLQLADEGISILLGPNGSGKTTLLKTMHGVERPNAGTLQWNVGAEDARLRQAFVFQSPTILRRSVLDNIAYPLTLRGVKRAEARDRAEAFAARVGLTRVLDQHGMVLSGGEKQKLALARALILEPDLLFLDEPCANLDGRATRDIEEILLAVRAEGTRIVMSTHDLGQARRLGDEIWFLHAGQLRETTPKGQFFSEPQSDTARSYLRGDLLS
jgi:tungstate transport system ATP-binding protein